MNTYVTEEEQIEAIKKWWNRYGNHLLTGLIVILLSFTAWKYWNKHSDQVKQVASSHFEQLMIAHANEDKSGVEAHANTLFNQYGKTVYSSAARLVLAETEVKNKHYDKAHDYLQTVLSNSSVKPIQQVARIRLARLAVFQKKYTEAINYLTTTNDDSYLPLVYELQGDIYAQTGKRQQAQKMYQKAMKLSPQYAAKNPLLMMKVS